MFAALVRSVSIKGEDLLINEAVFGKDIQYIGSKAFAECPNLRRVEIPVADVDIEDDAFENSNNVILYAPIGGSVEQYAVEHSIFLEAMIP
ncbi:MAG: leucine-rich repeat protein [Anaerolineaceae bacterium]|nr:leucine-rich repeat protein [Anaerolineaceae bacterium]